MKYECPTCIEPSIEESSARPTRWKRELNCSLTSRWRASSSRSTPVIIPQPAAVTRALLETCGALHRRYHQNNTENNKQPDRPQHSVDTLSAFSHHKLCHARTADHATVVNRTVIGVELWWWGTLVRTHTQLLLMAEMLTFR